LFGRAGSGFLNSEGQLFQSSVNVSVLKNAGDVKQTEPESTSQHSETAHSRWVLCDARTKIAVQGKKRS
jgi:hypothetical protein